MSIAQAEELIRVRGERSTPARVRVFFTLLQAGRALTHQEIEVKVNAISATDRVTIYRVLEWLTKHDLAHKISGDDRVWRFNAEAAQHVLDHAHFKCNDCGQVFCLAEMSTAFALNLPAGYRSQQIELNIKGSCAQCNMPDKSRTTAKPHRYS